MLNDASTRSAGSRADALSPTDGIAGIDAAIDVLRRHADVGVLTARDDAYDAARQLFYANAGSRPAVIARPRNARGVAAVLDVARLSGLPLAVRSGGHGLLGHATVQGGIVLDLRDLRDLDIDTDRRTAWVGAGLTAGEYTAAVGVHGLATGFGDTGSVGIGGLTVGGGIGLLSRLHGLTIDNLLAAEVVTADGTVRVVDADTDPDLFWAIRGGGGAIAVVTRFKFRLHHVPEVVGGTLVLPATPEVISGFVAAADAAPEQLTTIAAVMAKAPPMPFLPPEVHGMSIVMATVAYAGSRQAGEEALRPLLALATPLFSDIGPRPYADLFPDEASPFHPSVAVESLFTDHIDLAAARTVMDRLQQATSPMAVVQLRVLGGAVSRVPAHATAYAHRDRRIMVTVGAMDMGTPDSPPDATPHRPWVTATAAALAPEGSGRYVNFPGGDDAEHARAMFPGATGQRLSRIKRRHDPDNLLRRAVTVPADASAASD